MKLLQGLCTDKHRGTYMYMYTQQMDIYCRTDNNNTSKYNVNKQQNDIFLRRNINVMSKTIVKKKNLEQSENKIAWLFTD